MRARDALARAAAEVARDLAAAAAIVVLGPVVLMLALVASARDWLGQFEG